MAIKKMLVKIVTQKKKITTEEIIGIESLTKHVPGTCFVKVYQKCHTFTVFCAPGAAILC